MNTLDPNRFRQAYFALFIYCRFYRLDHFSNLVDQTQSIEYYSSWHLVMREMPRAIYRETYTRRRAAVNHDFSPALNIDSSAALDIHGSPKISHDNRSKYILSHVIISGVTE